MQLVCPNCLAKNRVPDERLHDAPSCGKCSQPLWHPTPLCWMTQISHALSKVRICPWSLISGQTGVAHAR